MENLSKYIGNQIKSLRERQGLTQDDLAERLGTTRQSISRYENGERKANQDILFELSDIFSVSINSFFPNSNASNNISTIYNQLNQPRKEKVYSFAEHQLKEQRKIYNLGATAAGPALAYADDFVEEEKLERIPDKADFILTIKGRSMEPRFMNGEKVFVQSASLVENGEIAIVEIEGDGVTCKKVKYDYDNQKVILQSLNEDYEDMIYSSGKVKIVGRVIE